MSIVRIDDLGTMFPSGRWNGSWGVAEDGIRGLPKRVVGANLPAEFHLHVVAIGRAKVDGQCGDGWFTDDKTMRFLLNGLPRWHAKSGVEPDR